MLLLFQFFQIAGKFLRKTAGKRNLLTGTGMDKLQPHRVETLPGQARHRLFGAVHRVSQNGMPDMGHMHPDLVGAPGLQMTAHMGHARIPGNDLPVSHGMAAVRYYGHLFAIPPVTADGGVHRSAVLPEIARHQTFVGAGQGMVGKLRRQCQVGGIVFGSDDEPAGVPVDAVDDTGAFLSTDAGEGVCSVVQ